MSSAETTPRGSGWPLLVLRPVWSARSWRATALAVTGLALAAGTVATLAVVVILWGSAVVSLAGEPTGDRWLTYFYLLVTVLGPVPLLRCLHEFSALQRSRLRKVSGVTIAAPAPPAGGWLRRQVRSWGRASTWRQLAYHTVLAPAVGIAGGVAVLACWVGWLVALVSLGALVTAGHVAVGVAGFATAAVLLLAAPWVARGVAYADVALTRRMLGPDRAEALTAQVASLARSRAEVVAATDAERRRIERDLHDGAQQQLVSLAMNLGMARAALPDTDPARPVIESAHDQATQALAELRDLVRGLHPAVLDDRGLDAALSGIAARAPLPVRLRVDVPTRCSPAIEAVAYFVVSEALSNIAKHAAASRAEVVLQRAGDRLRIAVTDDGTGGATVLPTGADDRTGSGLRGLAQRAAAVDGTLTVHSPPGGPTTITVELPCE